MTRQTQATLAPTAQIMFKHGPGTRRVTRDAVHRGPGAWIQNITTDRMGKGAVFTVAGFTSSRQPATQHIGLIGAMAGMTVTAVVGLRVDVERLFTPFEFIGMAAATHAPGNPLQQPGLAADMGAVARRTARSPFALQMGVHPLELGQHRSVAGEAAAIRTGA